MRCQTPRSQLFTELRAVRFMIRLFCDRLGLTCGHSHEKKLGGQNWNQGTLEHAWNRKNVTRRALDMSE